MTYRESVNSDMPELIELSRLFEKSPYLFDPHMKEISLLNYPAFAYDMLLSPNSVSIVAEENGSIAGYVNYSINRPLSDAVNCRIGSILLLAVHNDFRGKGIGKRLVEKALDNLLKTGAKIITVGTDFYNYPAIQIYESCNFHFRMGWHIFRFYNNGKNIESCLNEKIRIPEPAEIDRFLGKLSRPVSLLKERLIDKKRLLDYLADNARRSLYKGKTGCYVYGPKGNTSGFINVGSDEITRRTLQTESQVYKILDVIAEEGKKQVKTETELLKDIKSRLKGYCLLELWLDAENTHLLEAAEDAGFHLSYTGVAFHYINN